MPSIALPADGGAVHLLLVQVDRHLLLGQLREQVDHMRE